MNTFIMSLSDFSIIKKSLATLVRSHFFGCFNEFSNCR